MISHKTKRLYFEDPYRIEFEANVVEKVIYERKPGVVLDQTCFYPESGGQPSDKGTINDVRVVKVAEEGEKIIHTLERDITSDKVMGKIDWNTRFDHMQQHTGQHILSQSFYNLLKGQTLSFHLGEDSSTVDIDVRGISEEDVESVEKLANEIVFQDRIIQFSFVQEKDIAGIPLRKPSVKEGLIRIVEVSGFDYSACGGTHPRRTGEVGLIKILKWERIRSNIRFEFVCGGRALRNFTDRNRVLRKIAVRFTVSEREAFSSVEKLFSGYKAQKKRIRKLQENLSKYEALDIIQRSKEKIIKEVFSERTPEEAKLLVLNIIKQGKFVVLFGLKLSGRTHVICACSESLEIDMRELLPVISPLIDGKGGGSPSLIEISGEETEKLEYVLDKAHEFINLNYS